MTNDVHTYDATAFDRELKRDRDLEARHQIEVEALRRFGENYRREGFAGPLTCKIVGITYRQLDYWARTNLIRPSVLDAKGSGSVRRYSYRDLIDLSLVKSLLDAGGSLQQSRRVIESLRVRSDLIEKGAKVTAVRYGPVAMVVNLGELKSHLNASVASVVKKIA